MHFPKKWAVSQYRKIKARINYFSDSLLNRSIYVMQATEKHPIVFVTIGTMGGCILISMINHVSVLINHFSVLSVVLGALSLSCFYKIVKIYFMRDLIKLEGIEAHLHYARLKNSHVASMNKIRSIFSNKWLLRSEKSAILMNHHHLYNLAGNPPVQNPDPECVHERDVFLIALMQKYLSNEELNRLLTMDIDDGRNIFGILIRKSNVAVIEKLLAIPVLDKYKALTNVNNGKSALLMASSSTNLTASAHDVLDLQLTDAQRNAHNMVALLIETSEICTNEQRVELLGQADAAGNTALRNLEHKGADGLKQMLKNALQACTDQLNFTGATLDQLGLKRRLPSCVLTSFMTFAGYEKHFQESILACQSGFKKSVQLRSKKDRRLTGAYMYQWMCQKHMNQNILDLCFQFVGLQDEPGQALLQGFKRAKKRKQNAK